MQIVKLTWETIANVKVTFQLGSISDIYSIVWGFFPLNFLSYHSTFI